MRLNDTDSEILRHAVREILVSRYPAPVSFNRVLSLAATSVGFAVPSIDLSAALARMKERGDAVMQHDPDGSTEWWTATEKPVLEAERARTTLQHHHD